MTKLNDNGGGYTALDALALVQGAPAHTRAGAVPPADPIAALTVLRHPREELAGREPELLTAAREQKVS